MVVYALIQDVSTAAAYSVLGVLLGLVVIAIVWQAYIHRPRPNKVVPEGQGQPIQAGQEKPVETQETMAATSRNVLAAEPTMAADPSPGPTPTPGREGGVIISTSDASSTGTPPPATRSLQETLGGKPLPGAGADPHLHPPRTVPPLPGHLPPLSTPHSPAPGLGPLVSSPMSIDPLLAQEKALHGGGLGTKAAQNQVSSAPPPSNPNPTPQPAPGGALAPSKRASIPNPTSTPTPMETRPKTTPIVTPSRPPAVIATGAR